MVRYLPLASLLLLPSPARALPGFVDALKKLHPEMRVSCNTCHTGGEASVQNVSEAGRKYYQELLAAEERTPPPVQESRLSASHFIVYGDSRDNAAVNKKMVAAFCKESPQAVFHTGDLVHGGEVMSQWQQVLGELGCLIPKKIFFPACGNHEGDYCEQNPVRQAIGNAQRYYATKVGDFTFLALDSVNVDSEQVSWLKSLPPGNYIPFFHHPAFPTLSGHPASKAVVLRFVPLFRQMNVKLVFTGHNHGYDRAFRDGITYATAGGGGAPLYPCGKKKAYSRACYSGYSYVRCGIQGLQIRCQTHRLNGDVVDSFSVDYPAPNAKHH